MNIAIILAGGIGSRVGADRPKQFIEVLKKPVLAYTIEVFQNHNEIDCIEVVCHAEWISFLHNMISEYNLTKVKWITDGGETFQKSVINGVFNLEHKINFDDIVLIHFGASPFVSEDIISDCIKVCKEKGNAISATDFYLLSAQKAKKKSVNNSSNYAKKYVDRDTIAIMNSPHAFKYELIHNIYMKAINEKIIEKVEPHTTTLMMEMGEKIYFSKGSQTNIKITCKDDIKLFEGYALMKKINI